MWYNSGTYPPGSALVGTEEFFGYQNGDKRFTSSQFRDFCNSTVPIPGALKDFKTSCGAVGDGVADDTAAFLTACANGGAYWLDPQYKFRIDAGNIPAANVAFVGAGIRDTGPGGIYGIQGSQIRLTSTVNPPFLLGNGVVFQGINFYYPDQTEANANAQGHPTIYPPLFSVPVSCNVFCFHDCQVTNCYQFFDGSGIGKAVGALDISGCRIYSILGDFVFSNNPEVTFIRGCLFSVAAFANNALAGGGTRVLHNFTADNGWWIKIVGDGTPISPSSHVASGFEVDPSTYIFGKQWGLWINTGQLGIANIYASFECARLLQCDPSGSFNACGFFGGTWYIQGQEKGAGATHPDCTGIYLNNPTGAPGTSNVIFSGVNIPVCAGNLATITGDSEFSVIFQDIRGYGLANGRTGPRYWGILFDCPNATFRFTGEFDTVNPTDPLVTAVDGIILRSADAAIIGGTFRKLRYGIDVETEFGNLAITGAVSSHMQVAAFATGTEIGPPTLTISNATVGDTLTATISCPAISGGSAQASVVVPNTGTPNFDAAIALAAEISAVSAIAGAGIFASAGHLAIVRISANPDVTGLSASGTSSGATVITASSENTTATPTNLVLAGNNLDFPVVPYVKIVPIEGGTYTLPNLWGDTITARLEPAGALNAITLTLPAAPADGQRVRIASTANIASVTVQRNATLTSQTILGFGTSYTVPVSLGQGHELEWSDADAGWLVLY